MKTKKEIPVRTYPSKGGTHKTEYRVFAREIHEHFCMQPKCKFKGRYAQQGVCYSTKGEIVDFDRLDEHAASTKKELDSVKKRYKGKEYVRWLEAMYDCASVNWMMTLDDLIRLRRDNSLLQEELRRTRTKLPSKKRCTL